MFKRGKLSRLFLLAVILPVIGLHAGCNTLTEDDTTGPGEVQEVPQGLRGVWWLFATQEVGREEVNDASSTPVWLMITSTGIAYVMYYDIEVIHEGDASWESSGGEDHLVLTSDDGEVQTRIKVLAYDEHLAQTITPIFDGSIFDGEATIDMLWIWAKESDPAITGVVNDIDSYLPVTGATVTATRGDEVASTITSDLGIYYMNVDMGLADYSVTVERLGYYIQSGTVRTDFDMPGFRPFSMVPVGAPVASIELEWSASSTADIDLRMNTPEIEGSTYTISYERMGILTSPPYAKLQEDLVDGPGPEIIDIVQLFPGTYQVFAFIGPHTEAGAVMRFKDVDGNVLETVEYQRAAGTGDYWHVGNIHGEDSALYILNMLLIDPPGGSSEFKNVK